MEVKKEWNMSRRKKKGKTGGGGGAQREVEHREQIKRMERRNGRKEEFKPDSNLNLQTDSSICTLLISVFCNINFFSTASQRHLIVRQMMNYCYIFKKSLK